MLHCEFDYTPTLHLSQIYKGFKLLSQKGLISLQVNKRYDAPVSAVLHVKLNNNHCISFDTLDGVSYVEGSFEDKIKNVFEFNQSEIIFKRAFIKELNTVNHIKVFPLGLNYLIEDGFPKKSIKEIVINEMRKNALIRNVMKINQYEFPFEKFEQKPSINNKSKVLFLTRLWNPDDAPNDYMREDRIRINQVRIEAIKACKENFGEDFTGGLEDNEFTRKICPELILGYSFTTKAEYLKLMKNHDICVATTGLHGSIGWKFGEYVAASRSIISEKLEYELPGNFEKNINYFEFNNTDELIENVKRLKNNPTLMLEMMRANHAYYNNHVQPYIMVKNCLSIACKEFGITF